MALRQLMDDLIRESIQHCHPSRVLPLHLPVDPPVGRTFIISVGKAAIGMATAAAVHIEGAYEGVVVARKGHGEDLRSVKAAGLSLFEASHPVPDDKSVEAAAACLAMAKSATSRDRVLFLLSGGASALMASPPEGVTLSEKQDLVRALVLSGATIREINAVRSLISPVKGGRLAAAAYPAEVMTLLISDVPGNDPAFIGSGPSVQSQAHSDEVMDIVKRYGISVPASLRSAIQTANVPALKSSHTAVVASGADALQHMEGKLTTTGWHVINLGDELEGEASDVGRTHGEMALKYLQEVQESGGKPVAILSGGELTVTAVASGEGGPNLEYLTGVMEVINERPGVAAMALDSDGIDGYGGHAGGFVDHTSLGRACAAGLNISDILKEHRTLDLFKALGDQTVTGPTGTNVNDLRVIMVKPR